MGYNEFGADRDESETSRQHDREDQIKLERVPAFYRTETPLC